ncbi:MAG: hypothetical protein EOP38_03400 [Rubrivivax sp.]|nr:MAG: hypothetical protein EOP38_03400 [Rubrivivax sp.]
MSLPATLSPRWSTASIPDAPSTSSLDLSSLRGHVDACRESRGRLFKLQCLAESAHGFVAPRFVTTLFTLSCVLAIASLAL